MGYVYDIMVLTLHIYSIIYKAILEHQISKGKPTPLPASENLFFWCDGLSSFLNIVNFFCTVFIHYKCY